MIRVLIADDHKLAREAYRALLARENDIQVVGEAHDGLEAVEMSRNTVPQVVVMDVAMPCLNGLGATQRIRELPGNVRVLIISGVMEKETVRRAFESGAGGFLSKHESFDRLVSAIRAVCRGDTYVSPEASDVFVGPQSG